MEGPAPRIRQELTRVCAFENSDNGESQSARRPLPPVTASSRSAGGRGKSELRRAVRRVTPGQGNLTDSGTENIPPFDSPLRGSLRASPRSLSNDGSARVYLERAPKGASRKVRVKRCGKSAPRRRQRRRQAKPRTEQGQIGWRQRTARPKPPGRSLEPASDRRPRGMVVILSEAYPRGCAESKGTEFGLPAGCDTSQKASGLRPRASGLGQFQGSSRQASAGCSYNA